MYILTWAFIILTGGILRLIFHWSPYWMLLATHVRCKLSDAEKVLVVVRITSVFLKLNLSLKIALCIKHLFSQQEKYLKHKCYHVKEVKTLTKESVKQLQAKEALRDETLTEIVTEKDHALSLHVGNGIFKGKFI